MQSMGRVASNPLLGGLSFATMNIVIVGAGEVGRHLAKILSQDKHAVSIIDTDPVKARTLTESLDVQALVGDGTRADVLNKAGASKADLVVVVSDKDRVNMLASLVAKQLGAMRVIIRLHDTRPLEGYDYFYKQALGFDVVLSTEVLASKYIIEMVRQHHALEVETFAEGRVHLRRFPLREESELTSEPLQGLRLPAGVLVVAVNRNGMLFMPKGEDTLLVKDQIFIIGAASDCDAFERLAGERSAFRRAAVIMGAGSLGSQLARALARVPGLSVRVIERDPVKARILAAAVGESVLVIEGDATDLALLGEERISEANLFIATTKDDENNMIACQLAKTQGVERTVAMINKSSYGAIYDLLDIDYAISPRQMCANQILRFVRAGSPQAISVLAEGKAEVIELTANFRDPIKVKALGLPPGAVIGAVVHGDSVLIAKGDTSIERGDRVILFVLPDTHAAIEKIFHD